MTQNRLGAETSPYLLQHKDNPVHWWAWGPEALAQAKASGRPILLSVGYAACHWCHVMAHESFEDEATAALMNALFVNIKVDREERPDIDAIYMAALHALGERGGWPLTMFLTSAAEPFWGGTYFPKDDRYGRAGFSRVLTEIARIYAQDAERVMSNAAAIRAHLMARAPAAAAGARLELATIAAAARGLARATDPVQGGLSGAPKFPQFSVYWLLWQAGIRLDLQECREAVLVTLRNICQGGIYDHIGGGFARYSVDERWLVPHFEKMLYDNALLLQLLTEAFRETAAPLFGTRITETAEWLLRDMRTPDGGFASSYDADSEGEEGRFYVWTPDQITQVLGSEDGALFCAVYGITDGGNFEGASIPNRLAKLALEDPATERRLSLCQERLRVSRAQRIAPGWDDKVLADWNGLVIVALAQAGQIAQRPDFIAAAISAFALVRDKMQQNGRLWHAMRQGQLRGPGTASDYANMTAAAIALHQVTGTARYLDDAVNWTKMLKEHFWLSERGGYALTADDTTDVIIRTVAAHDDAAPNANGVMIANLTRLYSLTADDQYRATAEAVLRAYLPDIAAAPSGHAGLLAAALELASPMQVVIVDAGHSGAQSGLAQELAKLSLPGAVEQTVASLAAMAAPSLLSGKSAIAGHATAYVCAGGTCSLPITAPEALHTELIRARHIQL